ncbi:SPFH domain-containing protein [Chitinimonas koreensis]|uniref:SPFH domain-containing protein n=1 Tax=Chitinimonas koreensis TaxID=356302 RepID=UPI000424E968|nr:SPFH domain-containing protein [Chitinimonas koreensis]QNM98329.1 SPFH domain-containing protein [Chitinimonas koreensis]
MKKTPIILAALLAVALAGCSRISTDPGTETVLVDKPYFVGHGGVRDDSQKPGSGWYWWSTSGIAVPIVPIKIDERFDDLITAGDNIPVDFNSYLQLQIREPVAIIKKYGEHWYDNNLKEQYRTIVRNAAKRYTLNQLLSDNQSVQQLEEAILASTRKLVKDYGLPVAVLDVNLGKVLPDGKILEEINETGRQKQRSKTMEAAREAENQRKEAERSRAAADNAYRNELGLTPEQFIKLEDIKARRFLYERCDKGCTVIVSDGTTPLVARP